MQEKVSVKEIEVPNDVIHPMLGIPTPMSSQCLTCDAKNVKTCEGTMKLHFSDVTAVHLFNGFRLCPIYTYAGHFGFIKFPYPVLHPYFISDVVKILNRICVKCKSERIRTKVSYSTLLWSL